MTPHDSSESRDAERSARRWSTALYAAAFAELPDEVTSTTNPRLGPGLVHFTAYPSLNQAPLSVSLAGLIRDPLSAANLLVYAQRFESTLRLAVAPVTSDAAQPRFHEHPRPVAAATARGSAGALTVVEHEVARRPNHQPWLSGDQITLRVCLPQPVRSGLFLPTTPLNATLSSPQDGLAVAVELTPTRQALSAKLLPHQPIPVASSDGVDWSGTVTSTQPPFGLRLSLRDPGLLNGHPFGTASWMVSDAGFAISVNIDRPREHDDLTE